MPRVALSTISDLLVSFSNIFLFYIFCSLACFTCLWQTREEDDDEEEGKERWHERMSERWKLFWNHWHCSDVSLVKRTTIKYFVWWHKIKNKSHDDPIPKRNNVNWVTWWFYIISSALFSFLAASQSQTSPIKRNKMTCFSYFDAYHFIKGFHLLLLK